MSKKVSINYNDQNFELDLVKGSENENGIDISSLRNSANLITLDPGFKNTGSCKSSITFLDGEKGILRYRGYSIEDLAKNANFLEVAFLLIYGELPNKSQLDKLIFDINENAIIDEDLKKILEGFPKSAHPMGILSSLTSALIAFNPEKKISLNNNNGDENDYMYNSIVKLLNPNHKILNYPNKINLKDFNSWVQERGLYFPNKWDQNFDSILAMNDPGENEKKGSLLVANYGKGTFIYTGLSFFRQLPNGVPGAYKLFVNLISYGK